MSEPRITLMAQMGCDFWSLVDGSLEWDFWVGVDGWVRAVLGAASGRATEVCR